MPIRISPSGPILTDEEIAGDLRYTVLADDSAISGTLSSYEPQGFSSETTDIRLSLGGNAAIHGMPLDPGQQIVLRLSRTVPEFTTLALIPESSSAVAAEQRFNTPNNFPVFLRRGEGVLIHNTGARNNVQAVGENNVKVLRKNQSTFTATNATTELTCGGVITFLPNVLVNQMMFLFEAHFEFTHTATADPLINVGFAVNGTPTYHTIVPAAAAATYSGTIRAMTRIVSPGSGASWRTTTQWKNSAGADVQSQSGGGTTLIAVDTTVQNTLELRMRMQTAVANNTLSVFNAYAQAIG